MNLSVDPENVFSPYCAANNHQNRLMWYMEKLRAADTHALGFLPLSVMLDAIVKDRVLIELENGEPTGFLWWSRTNQRLKVWMIAIQLDNRRIYHARNLLLGLFALKQNQDCDSIQLRCADDLPANSFWKSVGFIFVNRVDGGLLRADVLKPIPGTDDYMIARALGKGILLKAKKKKNIHRQINVWRLTKHATGIWTRQSIAQPVDCFLS